MLGSLRKRKAGTPLSAEELEQRREAGRASAAKRRRSIGDYEREVRAIPMLGEQEERDLVSRWKGGDTKARDRVVEAHLRLAVSGARRLLGYGLPIEDLVAAGNIGLLQAAEKFDPSKGVRFSTFAMHYVGAAQKEHVLKNWSIVRMGSDRDQKRLFFSLRGDLRAIEPDASEPERYREIAQRRGVKVSSVEQMAGRLSARDVSLNVRVGEDEDGDEWIDRLAGGGTGEDDLVSRETSRIKRASVARAIAGLTDRERRVLSARWLRDPPATLQEVGRSIGVSAERVRQIEAQAMRRVRDKVAAEPRLSKRTPGAPLSDKELRQRREAARARWATGGGALAGALAATGAAQIVAGRAARTKVDADNTGVRGLRLAATRRERRSMEIEQAVEGRKQRSTRPFRQWPGSEQGPSLNPVNRRLRDIAQQSAADRREVMRADARILEIDEAFTSNRPIPNGMGEGAAQRLRSDRLTRIKDAGEEAETLRQAKPTRWTFRDEHDYARSRDGRRAAHRAKVPASIPPRELRQIRGAVRNWADEVGTAAQARLAGRWHREAPGLRDAFRSRAARVVTGKLAGKWRLPAAAAGLLVGAAAGYGASKLAKAAPVEPIKAEPTAGEEADLARRLASLFRSWMENPSAAGRQDDVADAMGPLFSVLRRSADGVAPPGGEESLYGSGEGRAISFDFDARNPEVERRLQEYALDRIRAITAESRETIRRVLVDAAMVGAPVDEQARRIREAIGLSPGQQGWVTTYRQGLEALDPRVLQRALRDRRHDGPIRRAIDTGERLSAEDIDRYVQSYQRRTLAYRAMTIARTEALRGANTGLVETSRVMLQENPEITVEKVWIATADERTRDAHRELDGKRVMGLDAPFQIDGKQIRWPHDDQAPPELTVNCRCTLGLRIVPKPGYGRLIAEAV